MRIFVTGAKGQLGRDCVQILRECHVVKGGDLPECDITSRPVIEPLLDAFRPDVILNCAAYTHVDNAESNRDEAWRTNVEGPRVLAEYVERRGGHLIHISTDYVFDGRRPVPHPYLEDDPPGPTCFYGLSKLQGERAVQAVTTRYTILRTAWLYGLHGRNFLKTILRLALKTPPVTVRVVDDQFGSPTWSRRLALQIAKVLEARLDGLFHATAEDYCTWFQLADFFLKAMGVRHSLVPCKTEEYPTAAHRPKNSILENARLKATGLNIMVPWQADVAEFVAQHRQQLLNEVSETCRPRTS